VRQRASQSLSRLTGGIAHEFNNLFTGLILLTENLQSSADATLQKSLVMMMDAFHHGSSLTKGMLAYSGRQFLEPGRLEIGPVLQNVSAMISALHGKSAKIALEIASDCGAIDADGRQLMAALAELAANGVEAAAPAAAGGVAAAGADATGASGAGRHRVDQ
jgi:signal transduction histidine kinase